MPARSRRKRKPIHIKKERRVQHFFTKLATVLLVTLSLIAFFSRSKRVWNNRDKVSLVVRNPDGGVNLLVLDPELSETFDIYIPGNTEVEVAEQLGIWKLRSVWSLGEQEGYGDGNLVARTITKHFKFPVYLWADTQAVGFVNQRPSLLFKAATYPYKTNLNFFDKLGIAFFLINTKNPGETEINLADTLYLKKTTLVDAEEGYIISGSVPRDILALFHDSKFSTEASRIMINDRTGRVGFAEDVSQILDALGGKVSSINREKVEESGCVVSGKVREAAEKVAVLIPCVVSESQPNSNFDLEVRLGSEFLKRY